MASLQVDVLVVAHGLGCRLLAEVVGGDADSPAEGAPLQGTGLRCFFVAPDIKPNRFSRRLAAFPAGSSRTVYCSAHDSLCWPGDSTTEEGRLPCCCTLVMVEAELEDGCAPV